MSDLVTVGDEDGDGDLVEKKGTTSYVWNFFGIKKDDDTDKDSRICRKSILARGGNTSNLSSHLRNHHPKEYAAVIKAKDSKKKLPTERFDKTKQATTIERKQPYPTSSKRAQEITNALSQFIAKEMMPFNIVERPGFQRLLQKLDDHYEIPSRKYFTKVAMPALYTSTREKIAGSLKSVQYYSITTDMWSSGKMEPYLALTVHFVDKEWVLQSHCLQTIFIPQDHTAENLMPVLQGVLESWGLPENRLACATTDNGTNIVAAMKDLQWNRLSCFGINLHLAITNSTKNDSRVTRAIDIAHKIINAFAHSWKKKRDLTKLQVELKLPSHSLITVSLLTSNNTFYSIFLAGVCY